MAYDSKLNFAYSTVATAPSPASSGTSLVVQSGQGTRFPSASFNAVVWPVNQNPLSTNSEIVRVTAISTDTFTITRTQEGTSARSIQVGDQIATNITAKWFTDIETIVPNSLTQGSAVFIGASSVLSQDNSNYFWDNTNKRLGIGTASPGNRLHLYGSPTELGKLESTGTYSGFHLIRQSGGASPQDWMLVSGAGGNTKHFAFEDVTGGVTGGSAAFIIESVPLANAFRVTQTGVGIGKTSNNARLDVSGGIATALVAKTGAYTATISDSTITGDATGGAFTITLPTAASITGRMYTIKRINSGSNAVTVGTTSSQTIDGATTYSLSGQWKYVTVQSDGANWLIIANN